MSHDEIKEPIPTSEPEVNPKWPFVLTEKVTSKKDGTVLKQQARGLTSAMLSRLHIGGADSHAIYKFKRKFIPIIFELEDVEIEFTLTKQNQ